ncbi:MAG TPA: hypothetical protein VD766_13875 [Solirubrobacterales bacterium]|nr:hypothetical protein [Solirubrobacterales bacterium]
MPDPMPVNPKERVRSTASRAAADPAASRFVSLSAGMRGCAIFGPDGLLAASGDGERWLEAGRALLEAADGAAGQPATHAHVATEDGEAFALRLGNLAMVAVTERFVLASLVFADMRAALRESRIESPAPAARVV